jgi:hypothetical protein
MTLRYAHLAPEHKAAAVEKLVSGAAQTLLKIAAKHPRVVREAA